MSKETLFGLSFSLSWICTMGMLMATRDIRPKDRNMALMTFFAGGQPLPTCFVQLL